MVTGMAIRLLPVNCSKYGRSSSSVSACHSSPASARSLSVLMLGVPLGLAHPRAVTPHAFLILLRQVYPYENVGISNMIGAPTNDVFLDKWDREKITEET